MDYDKLDDEIFDTLYSIEINGKKLLSEEICIEITEEILEIVKEAIDRYCCCGLPSG